MPNHPPGFGWGYARLMEGVFGRDCVLPLDIRALGSLCLNPSF